MLSLLDKLKTSWVGVVLFLALCGLIYLVLDPHDADVSNKPAPTPAVEAPAADAPVEAEEK